MRIAVLSDIHGNQIALEAVLCDLKSQPCYDQLVVAGDLCLGGPRPGEVLQILRDLHCPVIHGNGDWDLVTQTREISEKRRSSLRWVNEQIGQDGIDYLAKLPFSHRVINPDGRDLLIVHANPANLKDALFPNADDETLTRLLGDLDENVGALAFGHLHIAYTRRWHGILLVDVGSCGIPRDEDIRASYGILSWQDNQWQAEIRRVPYNVQSTLKQIKSSGMPNSEKRIKVLQEARY
jgi:predicted phosphodiesterase